MPFNPILHAKSKQYYWKGAGALSIKTFRNGRAYYNTGQGHYMVEEGRYLLLNRGQEYSITIESESTVESFCVFFPDGMIDEVYHNLVTSNLALLDLPFGNVSNLPIEFMEKTYPNDNLILPAVFNMSINYPNLTESIWLEEKMHDILQNLLLSQSRVYYEMMKLPSLKASTREELYRRVYVGHEYILAYFNRELTLTDIAETACLSPNHFLRNYKLIFGVSPHQFLIDRRLSEAKKLLLNAEKSVIDVCLDVGFQSHSSFSNLFKTRFGESPTDFQKKVIFDKLNH